MLTTSTRLVHLTPVEPSLTRRYRVISRRYFYTLLQYIVGFRTVESSLYVSLIPTIQFSLWNLSDPSEMASLTLS